VPGVAERSYSSGKIDGTYGKATMVIALRDPRTGRELDYCPSHDDVCEGLLGAMLQAELENDLYTFRDARGRRPTQIFRKIRMLRRKLEEWRAEALSRGLAEAPGQGRRF